MQHNLSCELICSASIHQYLMIEQAKCISSELKVKSKLKHTEKLVRFFTTHVCTEPEKRGRKYHVITSQDPEDQQHIASPDVHRAPPVFFAWRLPSLSSGPFSGGATVPFTPYNWPQSQRQAQTLKHVLVGVETLT